MAVPISYVTVIPPPVGLVVDVIEIDGETLVLFEWPAPAAPALHPVLTTAERDVVDQISRGASNLDIARSRGTSTRTVANQIQAILRKFGVHSRHELLARIASCSSSQGSV